jgi:cell division septum initiation protein DivIVA
MNENPLAFRRVRRGYDPVQVAAYVGELTRQVERASQDAAEMARLAESLKVENDAHKQKALSRYRGLGERIEQMFALAEADAAEIRANAAAEGEAVKAKVEKWAADLLEDARRDADQIRSEAERAARVRREEAEAHLESQRAEAGRRAAELETTLAFRRQQAEQEYEERLAEVRREEVATAEHAEMLRQEAQEFRAEAERKADRLLEEAERRSNEIVEEARAAAERARAESEREVMAAMARRDSIDTQLANLRKAFGALGGLVPALVDGADNGGPSPEARQEAGPDRGTEDGPDAERGATQGKAAAGPRPDDAATPEGVAGTGTSDELTEVQK